MSWTLTTQANAIAKAGRGANATIVANTTALAVYSDEAEGRIMSEARRDFVSDYANLTDGAKGLLSEATSCLVAMMIIEYDMRAYTSREEAGTMLDILDERYTQAIKLLKEERFGVENSVE